MSGIFGFGARAAQAGITTGWFGTLVRGLGLAARISRPSNVRIVSFSEIQQISRQNLVNFLLEDARQQSLINRGTPKVGENSFAEKIVKY